MEKENKMNITETEAARMLDIVLAKVLSGKPKGYSIIFTRDQNIYKNPGKVSNAWKDVLDGHYSNGIGKDVIFETPVEVMFILRNSIGIDVPRIRIQEYVLPIPDGSLIIGYLNPANPVIVTKK